jgi:parvulin-like peptidyl-prolyl isomerase
MEYVTVTSARFVFLVIRRINMKRFLILSLLISTGVAVFTPGKLAAQSDLQPVAIIQLTKSEPITVKQLKTELEKLAWQSISARTGKVPTADEINREVQNVKVEDRRKILDALINDRLALQAAERDKVSVSENEINQQITQLKGQMAQELGRQVTDEEFALAVKNETGMDLPAFRETLRKTATAQKYLMTKKQDVFNSMKEPTETEILNIYNLRKAEFIRPDMIRFSTINVPYGQDAASKSRARTTADRMSREIGSNVTKFDEAIQEGLKPNAGYQVARDGYVPRNPAGLQMTGTDFINTAFSLKQGEVSRVIEGPAGYLIVKVTETLPQKSLALDDPMDPGGQITVRQYISVGLLEQKQMEIVNRATSELITELRKGSSIRIMENNLNW